MADIFDDLGITQTGEKEEDDIFEELGIGQDVQGRPTGASPELSREEFIDQFVAQRQPATAGLGEATKGVFTVGGPRAVSSTAALGELLTSIVDKTVREPAEFFIGLLGKGGEQFLQRNMPPVEESLDLTKKFFSKENNIYMHMAEMNSEDLHPSLFRRFSEDKSAALDPAWMMFNVGNVAYQFLPVIIAAAAGTATGVPGLGFTLPFLVGGGLEAGNVYKDERGKGKTEDQALKSASAAYVVVGLLEAISASKIVGGFAKGGIARRMVGGAAIESSTEAAEELAIGTIVGDDFNESLKNAVDVLPASFSLGLITAGVLGGGSRTPKQSSLTNIKTLKNLKLDKTQTLELSLLENQLNKDGVTPEQANNAVQGILKDIDSGKFPQSKKNLVNAAVKSVNRVGDQIYQNLILNEDTIKSAQESAQVFEGQRAGKETKKAVDKITKPTGKVAKESAEVFKADKPIEAREPGKGTVPEQVANALGKPTEVKLLESRGVVEEADQMKAIIKDAITQPLMTAKAFAKRGDEVKVKELQDEVNNSARLIREIGGEVVEAEVAKALKGETPTKQSLSTSPEMHDAVIQALERGMTTSMIDSFVNRLGKDEFLRAYSGPPKPAPKAAVAKEVDTVVKDKSGGVDPLRTSKQIDYVSDLRKRARELGMPSEEFNNLLGQGVAVIEAEINELESLSKGIEEVPEVDVVFNDDVQTASDATRDLSPTGVQIMGTRDSVLNEFFVLKGNTNPSNKLNSLSDVARNLMFDDLKTGKLSISYDEVLKSIDDQMSPETVEKGVQAKDTETLYEKDYVIDEVTEDVVDEMDNWLGILGSEEGSVKFNAKIKGFGKDKTTIDLPPVIEALTKHAEASRKAKSSFQQWASYVLKQDYADVARPFLRFAWQTAENNIRRDRKNAIINKKLETLGDAEGKAIISVTVNKKGKIKKTNNALYTTVSKLATMMNLPEDLPGSLLDIVTPRETMFDRLDNLNKTTIFGDLFYDFTKRETSARRESNAILDKITEITKGLNPIRLGTYAAIKNVPELRTTLEEIDGIDTSVMDNVTPKEKEAHELSRKLYDEMWIDLNKARTEMGEEAIPYNVDYFTFVRLDDYISKAGSNLMEASKNSISKALAAISPNLLEPFHSPKDIKFPFLKRQSSIKPIDLNFNKVFELYTKRAKKYQYLGPLVANVREMTNNFHVGLNAKGSPITYKLSDNAPIASEMLNSWADTIISPKKRSQLVPQQVQDVYEAGVNLLTRNIATYTLGLAFRSFIIQPTANALTASYIGPKAVVKGHKMLLDPKQRKFAMDNSNHLISRSADVQLDDMAETLVRSGIMEFHRKMSEKAFIPLQWLDIQSATAGWLGAYTKFKDVDKLSHENASRQADRVIRKTHAAAGRGYRSPIQLTTTGKLVTLFQTFAIGEFAYVVNEVMNKTGMTDPATGKSIVPEAQAKEQAIRVIKLLLIVGLVNAIYEDGLGLNSPMPSPTRAFVKSLNRGDSMTEALIEIPKEFIAQVPVIGGGPAFGSSVAGAGVQHVTDVLTHFSNKTGPKKSGIELIAKSAGVPGGSQIKKMRRALEEGGSPWDIFAGTYKGDRNNLINYILYMVLSEKGSSSSGAPANVQATTKEPLPESDIFEDLGI